MTPKQKEFAASWPTPAQHRLLIAEQLADPKFRESVLSDAMNYIHVALRVSTLTVLMAHDKEWFEVTDNTPFLVGMEQLLIAVEDRTKYDALPPQQKVALYCYLLHCQKLIKNELD